MKSIRELGREAYNIRKRNGLTAKELATLSGLSHASISNVESGHRASYFTIDELMRICKAMNIPITEYVPELEAYMPGEKYLRKQELLKELFDIENGK